MYKWEQDILRAEANRVVNRAKADLDVARRRGKLDEFIEELIYELGDARGKVYLEEVRRDHLSAAQADGVLD